MKYDLRRMRDHPASIKRRELVGALLERGWIAVREGKHQIWRRGSVEVAVPYSLKAKWTAQDIVKQMIEVESEV